MTDEPMPRKTIEKFFGKEVVAWTDVLTVVSSNPARGIWWTRPDTMPWLPVLVHVTCLRASGRGSAFLRERLGAHILWREKQGAMAYRLFDAQEK